jgi:hypothetical protein
VLDFPPLWKISEKQLKKRKIYFGPQFQRFWSISVGLWGGKEHHERKDIVEQQGCLPNDSQEVDSIVRGQDQDILFKDITQLPISSN